MNAAQKAAMTAQKAAIAEALKPLQVGDTIAIDARTWGPPYRSAIVYALRGNFAVTSCGKFSRRDGWASGQNTPSAWRIATVQDGDRVRLMTPNEAGLA